MRMQEHRKKAALVAGCSSLWTSPLPPTFLPKGNGHFCSSFRKKFACGAQPKPLFAGERSKMLRLDRLRGEIERFADNELTSVGTSVGRSATS